jgi:hypothetical protein
MCASVRLPDDAASVQYTGNQGGIMWYGIGFGAILYIVLLITLGVMTLRKGHWVMFILGIFFPLFWLIGAVMRPAVTQPA